MTNRRNVEADSLSIEPTRPDGSASRIGSDRSGDLFLAVKAVPATEVGEVEGGTVMILLDVDGGGLDRVLVETHGARTDAEVVESAQQALEATLAALRRVRAAQQDAA